MTKDILEEIRGFYEKLYMTNGQVDISYIEKLNIPQITQEQQNRLDNEITITELGQALKKMKLDTSPGTDGLTTNFYKCFWPKIKQLYKAVIDQVIEEKCFHLSARRGILSLLEKPKNETLFIKNWRPLTLLNIDNKIYTKVLVDRPQETFLSQYCTHCKLAL